MTSNKWAVRPAGGKVKGGKRERGGRGKKCGGGDLGLAGGKGGVARLKHHERADGRALFPVFGETKQTTDNILDNRF